LSIRLAGIIGARVRRGGVSGRVVGRIAVVLVAAVVAALPFPTLIRLRVAHSSISCLVALVVYLISGIYGDVVSAHVPIDGVVAFILNVGISAVIVVVVSGIIVSIARIRPVIRVNVIGWSAI